MHRYVSCSTLQVAGNRAWEITFRAQWNTSNKHVYHFVSHLFLVSGYQVADLSEFWCADTTDGDHNVSVRNFSITLIIWVRESICFISYCLCFYRVDDDKVSFKWKVLRLSYLVEESSKSPFHFVLTLRNRTGMNNRRNKNWSSYLSLLHLIFKTVYLLSVAGLHVVIVVSWKGKHIAKGPIKNIASLTFKGNWSQI